MSKKSNVRRPDGRIAIQVYLGRVDGVRKYKTVYGKTQKEAEAAADEVREKLKKGIDLTADSDGTLKFWAMAWLKSKEQIDTAGWHKLCAARIQYWIDALGEVKINKIGIRDLEIIINSIALKNPKTNKPTAKKTLNEIKNVVNSVFVYAMRNRAIEYNPAQFIGIPRSAPKKERRALTDEEIQWIIDTPHEAQTAAMTMLFTGIRRGEFIPLCLPDIDLKNDILDINKAVDLKSDTPTIKPPKTKAGYRKPPIPKILHDYLAAIPKSNILVCSKNGRMLTNGEWNAMWEDYMKTLNEKYGDFSNVIIKKGESLPIVIEPFTAHCLRHTYCTMLIEAGEDVLTVKEYMGHSDIQTTWRIYTHIRDDVPNRPKIEKFDKYLECKSNARQKAENR